MQEKKANGATDYIPQETAFYVSHIVIIIMAVVMHGPGTGSQCLSHTWLPRKAKCLAFSDANEANLPSI